MEEQVSHVDNATGEEHLNTTFQDDSDVDCYDCVDYDYDDDHNLRYDENAIFVAATTCLAIFHRFKSRESPSRAGPSAGDEDLATGIEFVQLMEFKFRLWIADSDAGGPEIDDSLDGRLYGIDILRSQVLRLLNVLARNLDNLDKVWADSPAILVDVDREKIAVDSIREAVEQLQSLVRVIRDSYSLARNHHLPSEFITYDERDFENYALATVKRAFPHARTSLCNQLAATVALRRKRMLRKVHHQRKYGRGPIHVLAPCSLTHYRVQDPASTDSHSSMSSSIVAADQQDLILGQALSELNIEPSTCMTERTYPPKPRIHPGGARCACPYCGNWLDKDKLNNGPAYWEHHLDRDVQPYVCVSEECISPPLFFSNVEEWIQHMECFHSQEWTRTIHTATWHCNINHEVSMRFIDLDTFEQHIMDPSNHPDRGRLSEAQLDSLYPQYPLRAEEYSCPLCECVPDALKPVIQASDEPEAIRRQLHEHIAGHLKSLSVLSIPTVIRVKPKGRSSKSRDESKGI